MLDCYQVPVYSINLLNVAVLRNIIVCIETSDVVCSVAIGSSNSLIGEFNIIKKNSHSDIIEGVFFYL